MLFEDPVRSADGSDPRLVAPAAGRNREPIAAAIAGLLPPRGLVVELGSGSGEHAVHFARRFPDLAWQPTDCDPERLASIAGWSRAVGSSNLLPPVALDLFSDPWPIAAADVVIAINILHVSPAAAWPALLDGASKLLHRGGPLIVYGPFRRRGKHTSDGNRAFDEHLTATDPGWGIRDLEDVVEVARRRGFSLRGVLEMPANNLLLSFLSDAASAEPPPTPPAGPSPAWDAS